MRTQLVFILIACVGASCKDSAAAGVAPLVTGGQAAPKEHEDRDEEVSDLDRSIDELAGEECEHHKKTYACDICRYEVGFVRAPAELLQQGLFKTAKAERQPVADAVTLTGVVRFDDRRVAHVSTQVEGVIKKVHVIVGSRVRQGQPLLELESVALGEAEATYLETQGLLALARKSFERATQLRQEKIAAEKEYLQAKLEVDQASIRAEGALGKLVRLGANPEELRELTADKARGRLVLRAPMAGSVLVMHAVAGEIARTEEPVVTVGDGATVWVWADLYERDLARFVKGNLRGRLAATVTVKAYPNEEMSGELDLVSPAMDESSRTVKVRVLVPNAKGQLLAGMFATVKVFLPGEETTLALPEDAVLEDEGRSFVFVALPDFDSGDYFVRRPVAVGRTFAGKVEIKSGVSEGQTIVADGAFLMKSDVLRKKMGAGCAD